MFIIRQARSARMACGCVDACMGRITRMACGCVDACLGRITRMACGCVDACLDSITRNGLAFQGFTPNPLNYFWTFELTRFPCCVFIMTQARLPEWPVDAWMLEKKCSFPGGCQDVFAYVSRWCSCQMSCITLFG